MASSSTNQSCRIFSLKEIKSATRNFRDDHILGKGGFATVYLGIIDGGKVAVKRLIKASSQKGMGFDEEIHALTQIKHRNIVSLIGYCNKDGEKILVYEYIDNQTLSDHLHKRLRDGHSELSWNQRLTILIGVARGLYHLHHCIGIGSFIHRDLKSSNILLDKNLVAKVADFGLAKYVSLDHPLSYILTDGKGTCGYMDPYYISTRKLTKDSDTYSFGMVMLEVLSGRQVSDQGRPEEEINLSAWALAKETMDILDPVFHGNITAGRLKAMDICCDIAKKCLLPPKERPEMSLVLAQLELALHTSDSDSENVNPLPAIAHLAIPHSDLQEKTPIDAGSRGSMVYWSTIPASGQKVAFKMYKCQVPEQEFLAQVATVSSLNHKNVVKLHGYWMTSDFDYYMYEFASKKSLHCILQGLSWGKRFKIAIDIAKGLSYIHDEKDLIHRNLKSSNVLIFEDGTAKIADLYITNPCACNRKFQLPVRGGRPPCQLYHPPEFSKDGDTKPGDVYSYGVVLLELLTGKKLNDSALPEGVDLVKWAKAQLLSEEESIMNMIAPEPISEEGLRMIVDDGIYAIVDDEVYTRDLSIKRMAEVAVSCLANQPVCRPEMKEVLHRLYYV